MPDDLDLSRPVEAPLPTPVHVGRFRVDDIGRWVWSGAPSADSDALAAAAPLPVDDEPAVTVVRVDGREVLLLAHRRSDGSVAGDAVDLGSGAAVLAERVEQLEIALRTRPIIDQAKGMLMVSYRLSEDLAFRLLAGVSQASNRKLRDVAAELVTTWSAGARLGPPTARALAVELDQVRRRDAAGSGPRRPT